MSILVGAAFDMAANLIGSVIGPAASLAALVTGGIQAAGDAAGAAGAGAAAAATDAASAFAAAAEPEAVERRLRFLSWAYTAVWLILAAYLLLLSVRQRRLERLLRLLRDRVTPPGPTLRP